MTAMVVQPPVNVHTLNWTVTIQTQAFTQVLRAVVVIAAALLIAATPLVPLTLLVSRILLVITMGLVIQRQGKIAIIVQAIAVLVRLLALLTAVPVPAAFLL